MKVIFNFKFGENQAVRGFRRISLRVVGAWGGRGREGRTRARSARRGLLRGWASVPAPAEQPPSQSRAALGMCGAPPGLSKTRAGPRAHPLAGAHGGRALASRARWRV